MPSRLKRFAWLVCLTLLGPCALPVHAQFSHSILEGVEPQSSPDTFGYWVGSGSVVVSGVTNGKPFFQSLPEPDLPQSGNRPIQCIHIGSGTYCSEVADVLQHVILYYTFKVEVVGNELAILAPNTTSLDQLESSKVLKLQIDDLGFGQTRQYYSNSAQHLRELIASGHLHFETQSNVRQRYMRVNQAWALAEIASWNDPVARHCDQYAGTSIDRFSSIGTLVDIIPRTGPNGECERALAKYPAHPRYRLQLGTSLLAAGRYTEARQHLQAAAHMGYPVARYAIAVTHRDGLGTPRNVAEAFRLFKESEDVANSSLALGEFYRDGVAVPRNLNWAFQYFERAANAGSILAFVALGDAYYYGQGVARNVDAALASYRRAQPIYGTYLVHAAHMIGKINLVEYKDVRQGVEFLSLAADANYAPAQTELGIHRYEERSPEAAVLFERAVAGGSTVAHFGLALCYLEGLGVTPDAAKAVSLFTRAAEQGMHSAYLELGDLYARGDKVQRNSSAAQEYYRRASASEDPKVRQDGLAALERLASNTSTSPPQSQMSAGEFAAGVAIAAGLMYAAGKVLFPDENDDDAGSANGTVKSSSSSSNSGPTYMQCMSDCNFREESARPFCRSTCAQYLHNN